MAPHLCSLPLCPLVLLPIPLPHLILILFLKNLKLMNLTRLERPSIPLLVSTGLPVSRSTGVLTTQPWATPTPNSGRWLHPFSLLQHYAALLKVMNNLVYYDFIYLPMTPLAYSKIPKGLLPLTHKAKNYEFMCKNRSTAKNSTGTIWENLKCSSSSLKSNTEQTKNATPELPDHSGGCYFS